MIIRDVGKALRQARREAGLTQVELAERAGVHWNAIQKWEKGYSNPRLTLYIAAMNACGYTVTIEKKEEGTWNL